MTSLAHCFHDWATVSCSVPSKLMRLGLFCKHSSTFSANDEQFSEVLSFSDEIILILPCTWSRNSAIAVATGRTRGRSSSPGRVKNVLFSKSSRPVLGPTQPPIQWVLGVLSPGVKRPGREADHSPPNWFRSQENVGLYIHYPIRLHGVVLNCLGTGDNFFPPIGTTAPVGLGLPL
jgi:hypothetical protein